MINNSRGAKSYSERLRKGAKLNARLIDTLFMIYSDGNEPGVNVLLHDDNKIVLSGSRVSDGHRLHGHYRCKKVHDCDWYIGFYCIDIRGIFNPVGNRDMMMT